MSEHTERSRSGSGSVPRAIRFGQYELIRRIATGGMAEIFLAKQTGISGFERMLVIKRILPHLAENKEFITMFLDEARIAAQLTHPNVVQIYDLGRLPNPEAGLRNQDSYYIAMEYIHGEDIRKIYNQEVAREARIPFEYACHIIAQAAAGLDYAHRKVDISGQPLGLVHRDISPQNLLVTYDGHIKIVDFGVAKAANKMAQTRSGVLKGKYSYMSPEQAQGLKIDARTDIFALATVLYEITCGVRLFKRENELETLHAVIACDVTAPSKIDPSYPPALERIVMKALSKNPSKRHQSAGDLARDLDDYVQSLAQTLTARDVAGYMQDLFADKLAEELLIGQDGMWEEEHTDDHRKAEQKRDRAISGTKVMEDDQEEPRESTKIDRGSEPSGRRLDKAQEEAETQASGSHSQSRSRSGSRESGGWSQVSGQRSGSRDTRRDEPRDEQDFDMSLATDAATRAKPFQRLDDLPQTVLSGSAVGKRAAATPADKHKKKIGIAITVASGALILLLVLALAGAFDGVQKPGPVTFSSRPEGATIFVDGMRVEEGRTPLTLERALPLGPHKVRYQLDGYDSVEGNLQLGAGAPSTFELDLKPSLPAPTAAAITRETEKPAVAKSDPKRAEKSESAPKGTGSVSVNARVAMKIYEGKTLLGATPLQKTLPAGKHALRAVHDLTGWSETRAVEIVPNETAKLEFASGTGTLRINIQPSGNVKIGSFSAETPMAPLELPAGSYTVKLWNTELGKSESAQIRVTDGKETMLERNWRK
jgi:eukaryotic-like serine/threonine-protein kinase